MNSRNWGSSIDRGNSGGDENPFEYFDVPGPAAGQLFNEKILSRPAGIGSFRLHYGSIAIVANGGAAFGRHTRRAGRYSAAGIGWREDLERFGHCLKSGAAARGILLAFRLSSRR